MRRSCTNIQIRVRSSGYVNIFQWNGEWLFSRRVKFDSWFNVMAVYEVFWHGPKNHLSLHTASGKWVLRWCKRPFWFSKKIPSTFSSELDDSFLISFRKFDSSICDCKRINFHFFLENITFLCIESFRVDLRCVHHFHILNVCNHHVTRPNSLHPRTKRIQGTIQVRLSFPNWWIFDLILRSYKVILNQWTKRNDWGSPKRLSYGGFPSDKRSVNISQIGVCIPWNLPTIFSSRPDCNNTADVPFFHSACCSSSNPLCCRSVWCRRAMIPLKIFTGFTKFQGIVSVNDFRLPFRAPRTFASSYVFPEKFSFLHGYDWIHWVAKSSSTIAYRMIVSRFTNFHWELCNLL